MEIRRPRFLSVCTGVLVFNSLITEIHYLLILLKIIPIRGEYITVVEFAVADTLATAVPSFIGAYGLWRCKKWGWIATMIACGGYLHGMICLLTGAVSTGRFSAMNIVSVYFIVFSLFMIGYLWRQRELFD
jgi:uncharacterized membrane protein (DUF2068 family)